MTSRTSFSSRIFTEFFPPPKFLEMPAVGLDISDDAITALELIRRRASYAVGRFGRAILPAGAVAGGYVADREAVVGALKKLRKELGLSYVNASLSEEKAYLFKTRLPRLPRKEIRSALEFKLEENVPIPAAEAIFDYSVVNAADHVAIDHLDIAVTVLPQKTVEVYVGILKDAGFTPLAFEIEAQAIARAVVAAAGDRGAYLIVNFGESKTGLFIVSDETVLFTSTASLGSTAILQAVGKHFSLPAAETLDMARVGTMLREHGGTNSISSLTETLSALRTEVNKLSVYWRTHRGEGGEVGKEISRVISTGRISALPGLTEYLALALGIPAETGNVWRNICSFEEYIPPILFEESLEYAAAVGLALSQGH